ncbi:SDR family oxidoreductase [Amycolatopsis nigrescens]|uniref:SDR family oxidoreductase n=1 Tax=Amycolatopsis nigrescens TaxID=381445 RepID=UPI000475E867|nr:SDR family NAD(P)-dependent oxidoreductase [Amycolatopsis nigrescens]
MKLTDRVVVITGAAHGIGAAIARRLAQEKVRGVLVSDLDLDAAEAVADSIEEAGCPALARRVDATVKDELRALAKLAVDSYGRLDVFCSNAGLAFGTGVHAADEQWQRSWEVNVLQHVYAAQVALPTMLAKQEGYLLITASGAGLLSAPGDAPYTVTKHAAVGLAEWLAVTYRPRGVRVSALCPLGVRTDLLVPGIEAQHPAAVAIAAAAPLLDPADVAEAVVHGIDSEEFLILPHESVRGSYARKAQELDGWIDRTVAETATALGKRG